MTHYKPMKGYITLDHIKFHAHHGVLEQERRVGNDFEVTLQLQYPFHNATESDDLADTVNYAEVYDIVAAEMAVPSRLLEHVAGRIVRSLRTRFPLIEGGTVTVAKLTPPFKCEMAAVAVTIKF